MQGEYEIMEDNMGVASRKSNKESGAVAIFLVIFFALLLTVITLGFIRLMSQDQEQALVTDLSQSAFDSAEAGVEDAKRALLQHRQTCSNDAASNECEQYRQAFEDDECTTLADLSSQLGLTVTPQGAVEVATTTEDEALLQSYTCVVVDLETPDYIRQLDSNTSDLVPLQGTGDFSTVTVNWFLAEDAGLSPSEAFTLPGAVGGDDEYSPIELPPVELWGEATPPIMRVQLIQHGSDSFNHEDLENGSSTLFLYPVANGGAINNEVAFTRYARQSPSEPVMITCSEDVGGYACSAELRLSGSLEHTQDKRSYLRITPLYKGTTFQLELDGGNVAFDGIQPQVDSTGRANDLFRRVQSRIRFDDAIGNYPESALETTSDICKDFAVSSEPLTLGSCQPKAVQ